MINRAWLIENRSVVLGLRKDTEHAWEDTEYPVQVTKTEKNLELEVSVSSLQNWK